MASFDNSVEQGGGAVPSNWDTGTVPRADIDASKLSPDLPPVIRWRRLVLPDPADVAGQIPVVRWNRLIDGLSEFRPRRRDYPDKIQGTVELRGPKNLPPRPEQMPDQLLAMVAAIATVGIILLAFVLIPMGYDKHQVTELNGWSVHVDVAAVLLLVIPAVFVGFVAWRRYRATLRHLQERRSQRVGFYKRDVENYRRQLTELSKRQVQASLLPHPSPDECQTWAESRSPRLWERALDDSDFLDLRLGTGAIPAQFQVMASPSEDSPDQELQKLIEEARCLPAEFSEVKGMAITLQLARVGTAGLVGPDKPLYGLARALLMQLATHHAPDDVKVILVYPESKRKEWEWARWLPHTWNDERAKRYIATTPIDASRLINHVIEDLRRKRAEQDALPFIDPRLVAPRFVFVFADPEMVEVRLLRFLYTQGRTLGGYSLVFTEKLEEQSKGWGAEVNLFGQRGRLEMIESDARSHCFDSDDVDADEAEKFARSLARIPWQPHSPLRRLPSVLPLLTLLGANRPDDLAVLKRWKRSDPSERLVAPIGVLANGKSLDLNLREGSGALGMIVGSRGQGKSQLLKTIVSSFAIQFPPNDVAFLFVDVVGDKLTTAFRDLPHGTNTVAFGSDARPAARLIETLQSIIRHRQEAFEDAGVEHIVEYRRRCGQNTRLQPFADLVVAVDELGEMTRRWPKSAEEFFELIEDGAHLGLHVLATMSTPVRGMDEALSAKARFRICLRVEDPEDSRRILGHSEASLLREVGRGYFKAEREAIPFQSGWCDAGYTEEHPDGVVDGRHSIAEVFLDGDRRRFWPPFTANGQSHLQVIVSYIRRTAEQEGFLREPSRV